MPAISKVRFTNVVYEGGNKRYRDELFLFDGHNGAILLENGGGKTVFIQTLIQCVLPNSTMAERKMRDTLDVSLAPAHVAVEWILEEAPREYLVTCVTFHMGRDGLEYLMYCYDYRDGNPNAIEHIPFVVETGNGKRAATREEIQEYYSRMNREYGSAQTFDTRRKYQEHLENQYRLVSGEWEAMLKINGAEGGVDDFFEGCKTMTQLVDKLLIPTVEQGLANTGAQDFYRLFENHREHFREYLALGEQLKEYQRIDEGLRGVVERYREYDLVEREYRKGQGKGKTLWLRMKSEREQVERRLQQLKDAGADLTLQDAAWNRRKDGLGVWVSELERLDAQSALEKHQPVYDQERQAEGMAHRRLRNLEHLQFLQDEQYFQGQVRSYEEQLKRLESEHPAQEAEHEREVRLRQASYLFERSLTEIREAQQHSRAQRGQLEMRHRDARQRATDKSRLHVEMLQQLSRLGERADNLKQQMDDIAAEILLDKNREHVLQEREKWVRESEKIQRSIQSLMEQETGLKRERNVLKSQLGGAQESYLQSNKLFADAGSWLDMFQQEEQAVAEELKRHLQDLELSQALHQKEETIRHRLTSEIALLDKKVEASLDRERLAYRDYDLYQHNQSFTADPELERWAKRIQEDIPSLELGTTFALRVAQGKELTLEGLYDLYPLWPMTMVAAAHDLEKVKMRLSSVKNWTHPIHLITTGQALAFLQGDWVEGTMLVTPEQWVHLTESDSFHAWLEELKRLADKEKTSRQELEQARRILMSLSDRTSAFFVKYTYAEVSGWRDKKEDAFQKRQAATRLLETLKFDQEGLEESLTSVQRQLRLHDEQIHAYTNRIREANKWESMQHSREQALQDAEQEKSRCLLMEREIESLQRAVGQLNHELEQLKERERELKSTEELVIQNPLYQRVQDKAPMETEESLSFIKDSIEELEQLLSGWGRDKRQLETRIQEAKTSLKKIVNQKERHRSEYGDVIEESFSHIGELEEAVNTALAQWKQAQASFAGAEAMHRSLQERLQTATTAVEVGKQAFHKLHQEKWDSETFAGQPVEVMEEQLQMRRLEIDRQRHQNQQETAEVMSLQVELHDVSSKLDMFAYKSVHNIGAPDLHEVPLTDREEQEFPYDRMKFVVRLGEDLEHHKSRLDTCKEASDGQIAQFSRYLKHEVQEERIRQQMLDGLKVKTTYAEMSEWSDAMRERIHYVVQIAEQQQRESDQQVQHVISHLHTYIRNICHELRSIPKMTRVRFESGVKDIYDFTIPEWEEEEGLLHLRAHLEWMMKELEKEVYKNMQGQEDKERVKKKVEEWLHPRQLLQVLNSSHEIKVRCRKVTNDGKVSGAYTEWPQTENWSGGEKWSKNMTLFLGILNYLAEKRGHLRPGQNHRVVICDNPFGKASSDHVLSPVFHIAKQLGFQILALTAHAEGKFLRDYFPIIYSCKLRPTKDPSITVIEKEKQIHMAYFRDRAPNSLDRLGEEEQLTLLF